MNTPIISIALPALNSKEYIRQCVDSILAQTLKEIEILCIDAGSTDGTLEIFEEYAREDRRVRVIRSEKKSYGHQVNLALDAAKGSYFGIVESDDFIAPSMYEALFRLSKNGTVDVVKGNFYDYFDYEGMKPIPAKNGERRKMPGNGTIFTVNEYPHILEGHPSIWSAIYRMEFLRGHNIRFLEIPGGGWTDNPFFFETLCAAKSICWTNKPYYYYRKSNPNSSSNKIPDLTLPVCRMMDNLDVTDQYDLNDEALGMVYERAMTYLNGSLIETAFKIQEEKVREQAIKLCARMDERIVDRQLKGRYKDLYYRFTSPLLLRRPKGPRVLLYHYCPEDADNQYVQPDEEMITRIRRIQDLRYDTEIFLLTVRGSREPDIPAGRIEKVFNRISCLLSAYEVVNHPVLTVEMYDRFCEMFGPFTGVFFITSEGLDDAMKERLEKEPAAASLEQLLQIISSQPEPDGISLTAEEYRQMLRGNDQYYRIMEENRKGDIFDTRFYHGFRKVYGFGRKIQGGWLCCREHGVSYTIKLFLRRGH